MRNKELELTIFEGMLFKVQGACKKGIKKTSSHMYVVWNN